MQRACAPQRSVTCVYITADDTPLGNCCRSLTSSAATKAAAGGAAALHTGLPSRCAFCCLRSFTRCATDARWARSAATVSTKTAILYYSTGTQVSAAELMTSCTLPLLLWSTADQLSSPRGIMASAALHKLYKPFFPGTRACRSALGPLVVF